MIMIGYAIILVLVCLAIAKWFIDDNELDQRIDGILAEEKRQNKRIDILEKREQIRQSELRRDKANIESKDLFKEW